MKIFLDPCRSQPSERIFGICIFTLQVATFVKRFRHIVFAQTRPGHEVLLTNVTYHVHLKNLEYSNCIPCQGCLARVCKECKCSTYLEKWSFKFKWTFLWGGDRTTPCYSSQEACLDRSNGSSFTRTTHVASRWLSHSLPRMIVCCMSKTTPVLAWGWHGLTPTILFIKSKSTKSTAFPAFPACTGPVFCHRGPVVQLGVL